LYSRPNISCSILFRIGTFFTSSSTRLPKKGSHIIVYRVAL
jgi:hypothetical protein